LTAPRALAQGATDYPIPSSAREAYSPIAEGFEAPIAPREDLKGPRPWVDPREAGLKAQRQTRMPGAPAFFRDTDLRANSRTYLFDEHQFGLNEPEALTTGGSLVYQSGYIADFFQLRGALYTSQPLYANAYAGDTWNLTTDGDQITILGQANGRMKFAGQELTAGRQLVRTPYVNPYDVRMIPLTFEGVVLLPEDHHRPFNYIASYLTRYKPRDDTQFISFSEGLGIDENEGMWIGGASYRTGGLNFGFSNYLINNGLNTAYGEIDYLLPFGLGDDGPSVRVGVNYLDQRTVGEDLIEGGPYDTYQTSARIVTSYRGFVFTGSVSQTGEEADIQKPFGYSTSYTAMIVTSFEQASVRAFLLQASYDFERLGLEGVKFHVAWGKGDGESDLATNGGFANQEELDLRFAYEPHHGRLQGLRVELEYIDWQVFDLDYPSDDLTQFRAIVNYAVPLL
jgi:hypothetical protein